ncbi:MAG: L,D-transpeptidase [Deltaproteobacteria bacterium]|nr:L,D-transpeptidase [Deltaproteobacteria bacterium]
MSGHKRIGQNRVRAVRENKGSRLGVPASRLFLLLLFLASCSEQRAGTSVERRDQAREAVAERIESERSKTPGRKKTEPASPPKRIFAKRFVVAVRQAPNKDSYRIGYLRAGAVLTATSAEPVGHERCRRGWYQLQTGGFVCSGSDVTPFYGDRLPERRATQPDLQARLPYRYGCSTRSNTPIYRRLPTDEEAAIYEGYRIPGQKADAVSIETEYAEGQPQQETSGDTDEGLSRAVPLEIKDEEGSGQATEATEAIIPRSSGEPGSGMQQGSQDQADAGPPTLESLLGEKGSVLMRRMVKGFSTSLDREMSQGRRKYWRTQSNGFIPFDRLREVAGTEFRGLELAVLSLKRTSPESPGAVAASHVSKLEKSMPPATASYAETQAKELEAALDSSYQSETPDAKAWSLPIGYLLSSSTWAYKTNERGGLKRATKPGYHYLFQIIAEERIRGKKYYRSVEGQYFRVQDVTRIDARVPPKEIADGEKWIDVDLERQTLVAYIGEQPVYATLISSGRVKQRGHPQKDFATPTGSFRILSKHITRTMDGDHEVDGPYSIEDVPYVMYFQLAYALHSAFWHNGFGRPRSHGCINMAPIDAKWLFNWIAPEMPSLWHSVYPTKERPGTRLYIRGETPVR